MVRARSREATITKVAVKVELVVNVGDGLEIRVSGSDRIKRSYVQPL